MAGETDPEKNGGQVVQQSAPQSQQNAVDQEDYSVFTVNQKRAIVPAASLASFYSPLSSSIYFPALETIASSLGVSTSKVDITVTTYLVSLFLGSPT